MKGKKRFIVTMLFFINIIMLVAAVIPHHHHPNGMICMKQDQLRIRRHPVYGYDHRTFITTAGKTSQKLLHLS